MIKELMLKKKTWAVVGANQDADKFGNIIYKRLKNRGYEVYPVNPLYEDVEGDKCYKDLTSLPKLPHVINMVVPPKRAKQVIEEAAELGVKYVWFQPGTYDDDVMELSAQLGLITVKDCVLVATRRYDKSEITA